MRTVLTSNQEYRQVLQKIQHEETSAYSSGWGLPSLPPPPPLRIHIPSPTYIPKSSVEL